MLVHSESGATEAVMNEIARHGFTVLAREKKQLSLEAAEMFYADHKGKPYFQKLTTFVSRYVGMCSCILLSSYSAGGFGTILSLAVFCCEYAHPPLFPSFCPRSWHDSCCACYLCALSVTHLMVRCCHCMSIHIPLVCTHTSSSSRILIFSGPAVLAVLAKPAAVAHLRTIVGPVTAPAPAKVPAFDS